MCSPLRCSRHQAPSDRPAPGPRSSPLQPGGGEGGGLWGRMTHSWRGHDISSAMRGCEWEGDPKRAEKGEWLELLLEMWQAGRFSDFSRWNGMAAGCMCASHQRRWRASIREGLPWEPAHIPCQPGHSSQREIRKGHPWPSPGRGMVSLRIWKKINATQIDSASQKQ